MTLPPEQISLATKKLLYDLMQKIGLPDSDGLCVIEFLFDHYAAVAWEMQLNFVWNTLLILLP